MTVASCACRGCNDPGWALVLDLGGGVSVEHTSRYDRLAVLDRRGGGRESIYWLDFRRELSGDGELLEIPVICERTSKLLRIVADFAHKDAILALEEPDGQR